jgi:hypothetical protein
MSREELLARVIAFVRGIGVGVTEGPIERETLVPGIDIVNGTLRVDPVQMCAPSDALHEAGHIALTARELRPSLDGTISSTPAEEVTTIAWTWAAAMHLGIAPSDVFHDEVISGNGPTLRENFSTGRYVGVPMLQRWGMTFDHRAAAAAGVEPYPHMLRWLRD